MTRTSRTTKNQRTQPIPNGQFKWSGLRFGTKLVIIACMAAGIIATLIWAWPNSRKDNTTIANANVIAPAPAEFTDSNNFILSGDTIPDINNGRQLSHTAPLIISYDWASGPYQDAFKMGLTNTELDKNIKITPAIKGTWHMRGDTTIGFTPAASWPANQKFTVKINPDLFRSDVSPDTYSVSFTTPTITAQISSFTIYSDPAHPQSMIGVAVISFNYPIDTRDFNDKVSLKLDNKKLDFTVKFDKFRRTAMIISSPVAVTAQPQIIRLKLNKTPAADGNAKTDRISASATIESADNFFKISEISTTVAEDTQNTTQQLILLDTTASAASKTALYNHVTAYLLPRHKAGEDTSAPSHKWMADEITPDVLKESEKLTIKDVDFESPAP